MGSLQILTAPPSLREKVPEIPSSVEQVIMKALAKDPKNRYNTISDFAHALEHASQLILPTGETQVGPSSLTINAGNPPPRVMNFSTTRKEEFKVPPGKKLKGRSLDEDMLVWHISKRQVSHMIGGVLFYTLLSNLLLLIHFQPPGGNELLWILPALVIPLFFGVVYGPWVGLVTSGLGYFLGNYISLAINWHPNTGSVISFISLASLSLPWYFYVAFSSIGLVTGLAWFLTKGCYNSLRGLATAEIVSSGAILLAFLIAFNSLWPHLYTYETFWLDFTHIALPNMLVVLILLPLMLMIHNFFKKSKSFL